MSHADGDHGLRPLRDSALLLLSAVAREVSKHGLAIEEAELPSELWNDTSVRRFFLALPTSVAVVKLGSKVDIVFRRF